MRGVRMCILNQLNTEISCIERLLIACRTEPPGKVTGLKVTETSYSHLVLTWMKPEDKPGKQDEAKGYFVELRQADCMEWSRCNTTTLITTTFSVKGLRSMDMYWLRVIATNDGGESAPEELANYVIAMPSPGTSISLWQSAL